MIVLVIDMQKGITDDRLYDYDNLISNTRNIIRTARDHGVEVIYFQHDDGENSGFSIGDEDFEIVPLVQPLEEEKKYTKTINSCFGNKDFVHYLEKNNEKQLMLIGLQTNFCIDATVKSAFERGYEIIIPSGTNSTFDNDYMDKETTYRYYNEMMWPNRFAKCISMDETIGLLKKEE